MDSNEFPNVDMLKHIVYWSKVIVTLGTLGNLAHFKL
jgi:hypothetical protein